MTKTTQAIDDILQQLTSLPLIHSQDIPGIDLYMDQVTTFMEERLAEYRRNDDEKILTKTMINNYAKNKLLPPPEKKKYSREHMLVLVLIYYLKGALSLQDIQSILNPVTSEYFQNTSGTNITEIYDEIFSSVKDWEKIMTADVDAYREYAEHSFEDASEEDRDFLQYFSLICALNFDIYLKKKVIERLIDSRSEEKTVSKVKKAAAPDKSGASQRGRRGKEQ